MAFLPDVSNKKVSVTVGANTGAFTARMSSALKQMNLFKVGVAAGAAALAGLAVKGFVVAADKAADFEEAMIEVEKVTNPEVAEKMEEAILNMANTIPLAHEELAGIAEQAGRLGVEGAENIKEFTDVTAKMATATDLTAEQAADSFARISTLLDEPISNVNKMGSAINEMANNMATSSKEITDAALRSSGALSGLGLSSQEILGLNAAMNEVSSSSRIAGTQLRRFAQEMMEPAKVEKLASAYGMNVSEFKAMRKNAPLDTINMLAKTMNEGGDKADRLREIFSTTSRQTLTGLAKNLEGVEKGVRLSNEQFENATSLQKEFDTAASATNNKLKLITNRFDTLTIVAGQKTLPIVNDLADVFLDVLPSSAEEAENILDNLTEAFEAHADTIEDVKAIVEINFNTVKDIVKDVFPTVEGFIIDVIDTYKDFISGIREVLEEHEQAFKNLEEIISTATEFIIEIIGGYWLTNLKSKFDIIIGLVDALGEVLEGDFVGAWESVQETIEDTVENWAGFAEDKLDYLSNLFSEKFGANIDIFEEFQDVVENVVSGVSKFFDNILEPAFIEAFEPMSDELEDVKDAFGRLRKSISEFTNKVKGWFGDNEDSVNSFTETSIDVLEGLVGFIADTVVLVFEDLLDTIENVVNIASNLLEGDFTGAFKSAGNIIKDLWGNLIGFLQVQTDKINETFGLNITFFETFENVVESVVDNVSDFIDDILLPAFIESFGSIIDELGEYIDAFGNLQDATSEFANKIKKVFNDNKGIVSGFVNAAGKSLGFLAVTVVNNVELIVKTLLEIKEGGLEIVTKFIEGNFIGAFKEAFEMITEIFDNMVKYFKDQVEAIEKIFDVDFSKAISDSVEEAEKNIKNTVDKIGKHLGESKLGRFVKKGAGFFGNLKDGAFNAYDAIVGHSYIPDLVDEVGYWLGNSKLGVITEDGGAQFNKVSEGAANASDLTVDNTLPGMIEDIDILFGDSKLGTITGKGGLQFNRLSRGASGASDSTINNILPRLIEDIDILLGANGLGAITEEGGLQFDKLSQGAYNAYDAIVGHSYVPDMVNEVGDWVGPKRLGAITKEGGLQFNKVSDGAYNASDLTVNSIFPNMIADVDRLLGPNGLGAITKNGGSQFANISDGAYSTYDLTAKSIIPKMVTDIENELMLMGKGIDDATKGAMQNLIDKIEEAQNKNQVWGDSFDEVGATQVALKQTINELIGVLGPNSEKVKQLKEWYYQLEAQTNVTKTVTAEFKDEMSLLDAEIGLVNASMELSTDKVALLQEKEDLLNQQLDIQQASIEKLEAQYKKSVETKGENAQSTVNLKEKLIEAKTAEANLKAEIADTNDKMEEQNGVLPENIANFKDFIDKINESNDVLGSLKENIISTFKETLFDNLKGNQGLLSGIVDTFKDFGGTIDSFLDDLSKLKEENGMGIGSSITAGIVAGLEDAFTGNNSIGKSISVGLGTAIGAYFGMPGVGASVGGLIGSIGEALGGGVEGLTEDYIDQVKEEIKATNEALNQFGFEDLIPEAQVKDHASAWQKFWGGSDLEILNEEEIEKMEEVADRLLTIANEAMDSLISGIESAFSADTYSGFLTDFQSSFKATIRQALITGFMESETIKPLMAELAGEITRYTEDMDLSEQEFTNLQDYYRRIGNLVKPVYETISKLEDSLTLGTLTGMKNWAKVEEKYKGIKTEIDDLNSNIVEYGLEAPLETLREYEELYTQAASSRILTEEYLAQKRAEIGEDLIVGLDEEIEVATTLWEKLKSMFDQVKSGIQSAFSASTYEDFVSNLGENIRETIKSNLLSAFMESEAIKPLMQSLSGTIFTATSDGAIDNSEIASINDLYKQIATQAQGFYDVIASLGNIGNTELDIPMLATGGIVRKPTLAMIGEAGPEAVVPLNKYSSNNGSSGGDTYLKVTITGNTIADTYDINRIGGDLVRYLRRKGVKI